MLGKIMIGAGSLAVLAGGIGGFLNEFQSSYYALVPVGLLLVMVGVVQSLNTSD